MGKYFVFAVSYFVAVSTFAASAQNASKNFTYQGRVGKFVLAAMKSAGAEAKCGKASCKYEISDFYSAEETDGCGGGTTSYETSFTYANKTSYSYKTCDGVEDQSARRALANKGDELNKILGELDFFQTSGWVSSVDIQKIECYTERNIRNATCVITPKQ
jgi:hypothetical protein